MSNKNLKVVLGCLLGTMVCGAVLVFGTAFAVFKAFESLEGSGGSWQAGRDEVRGKFLDQPAPLFASTTLGGESWSLEAQRGKVVLIDFWASWCGPCLKALPHLREVHGRYAGRDDFVMVGISLDNERQDLVRCVEKNRVGWAQLYEGQSWENSIAELYEVTGIPHVLIVDREGVVRAFDPYGKEIERELERLLDSTS